MTDRGKKNKVFMLFIAKKPSVLGGEEIGVKRLTTIVSKLDPAPGAVPLIGEKASV